MRRIIILFCAVFLLSACEKMSFKDSEAVANLKIEAREMFPDNQAAADKWVDTNRAAAEALYALKIDRTSPEYAQIYAAAKKKFPASIEPRVEFVSQSMRALSIIAGIEKNIMISDADFAAIKRISSSMSADYVRRSEIALELQQMICEIKKLGEELPADAFKKEYEVFSKSFVENPKSAYELAKRNLINISAISSIGIPSQFAGIKKYLEKKYDSSDMRLAALKSVIDGKYSILGRELLSANYELDALTTAAADSFIAEKLKGALYYASIDGKKIPAYFVSVNGKNVFVSSCDVLKNGVKNIILTRGDESLNCVLYKMSNTIFGVELVPDSVPKGTPILANTRNFFNSLEIFGINRFGSPFKSELSPQSVAPDSVKLFPDSGEAIICNGAMMFDMNDKTLVAIKMGGIVKNHEDKNRLTLKKWNEMLKSGNVSKTLENKINKCVLFKIDAYSYPESFLRIAKIDSAQISLPSLDADKIESLDAFKTRNMVLIKAFVLNEYSYLAGDEVAKAFPELSESVKACRNAFLGKWKYSRIAFSSNYFKYIAKIREIIDADKINSANFSPYNKIELARETELRNAILDYLRILSSSKDLDKIIHKDLAKYLKGDSYIGPEYK